MKEEQKAQMIAQAENVEAISDFFVDWWSSQEMYKDAAEFSMTIMHKIAYPCAKLEQDEIELFHRFMEQHLMMLKAMEPFERKEADNEG